MDYVKLAIIALGLFVIAKVGAKVLKIIAFITICYFVYQFFQ